MLRRLLRLSFIEPIAIVVVWLVAAWPFLDPSTSVYGFDTLAYTGPNLTTTFDAWRGFSLPLWQADVFGGVPFLGRLGAQGLYFPHLPLIAFDINTALDLGAAFHLLVLAVGLYVLVNRVYGMSAPAAFVAACAVLGSSYMAIKMLSYDQLVAIAWIPWLLVCIELIVRHPRHVSLAGPFALVTSLLILGGHPQYIYFAALMAIGYAALRLIDTRNWPSIMTLVVGGMLTIMMTSLQLVSAYFLNSSSGVPGKRTLAALANPSYVLPPSRLPVGVFGDPFAANPSQVTGAGEAILGLGLPICLLAIIGAVFGRTLGRFARYGSAFGCLLGIILAVGPRWFPFRILYDIVPGFGAARVAGRWLVVPLVLGALLAAEGAGVIMTVVHERRRSIAVAVWAIVGLAVLWAGPFEVPRRSLMAWWIGALVVAVAILAGLWRRTTSAIAWIWIVVFVGVASFIPLLKTPATFQQSETRFSEVAKPLVDKIAREGGRVFAQTFDRFDSAPYLLENLRPNTSALANVATIDGYDGGQWIQRRWIDTAKSLTNGKFKTDLTVRSQTRFPLSAELMARLGVRWILVDTSVIPADVQLSGFNGPIDKSGAVELWENPRWVGHATAYLRSRMRSANLAAQFQSVTEKAVIVEDNSHLIQCKGPCEPQGVSEQKIDNDEAVFVFEIASDGILVLDQGWSPDWKVYIDGVRSETFPANGNQTGVYFTSGYHKVEFHYDPVWVKPLLALGIFALLSSLVMCVASIQDLKRHKRRASSYPSRE